MRSIILVGCLLCAGLPRVAAGQAVAAEPVPAAKNVILVIADGAGFNTWDAAAMYQGKWDASAKRSALVYDQPGWIKLACSTYPLNTSTAPRRSGTQEADAVYDPAKAWDGQRGYAWLGRSYTDSAAAATALSTGHKTYNNAINWSDLDRAIAPTLAAAAKANGRSVGVVTSVQWSHATPAGLSNAQNADRDNYAEIAQAMLHGGVMDVIMGAGNPDFDNNGQPWKASRSGKDNRDYKYVGGQEVWRQIEAARQTAAGQYRGFRPVATKAEFESLASGPTPAKVVGTAQVFSTLQQARKAGDFSDPAKDTPLCQTVPSLATMVRAAINVLDENPKGFVLAIESGAVDWANHANQPSRMIQEQLATLAAVQAVVEWVEAKSNWDETLVILTADHETGLLWGPKSDQEPFDPIVDQGPGRVPAMKYNAKKHTNSLVLVYARGPGSQRLLSLAVGKDPVRGAYLSNTDLGRAMHAALGSTPAAAGIAK
jgi:alkaline phosphatase